MRIAVVSLAALALIAGAGYWAMSGSDGSSPTVQLYPDDRQRTANGRRIYRQSCASCHGRELEGQPEWRKAGPDGLMPAPPHDETGHTWHHPDAVLFTLTRDGLGAVLGENASYTSAMPAFGDSLTDEEIVDVLSYIKSTWPEDIRATHDDINARAANG